MVIVTNCSLSERHANSLHDISKFNNAPQLSWEYILRQNFRSESEYRASQSDRAIGPDPPIHHIPVSWFREPWGSGWERNSSAELSARFPQFVADVFLWIVLNFV